MSDTSWIDKQPKHPIETEIKIVIANDEGGFGVATIGMGFGVLPTDDQVRARVAKFAAGEMPSGYRLATAPELFDYACLEKAGHTFATPANYRNYEGE
ncbi:hypothetical protein [Pseudomonas phage Rollin]|nr:hypothetical protein [Pseudomonas phage Rollin]